MADYTTDPDYIPKEGHDDSDGGGVLGLAINPKDGSVIQIMKSDPDKVNIINKIVNS